MSKIGIIKILFIFTIITCHFLRDTQVEALRFHYPLRITPVQPDSLTKFWRHLFESKKHDISICELFKLLKIFKANIDLKNKSHRENSYRK